MLNKIKTKVENSDWLFGGFDACHPMPKASRIMAEYIYNEFKGL